MYQSARQISEEDLQRLAQILKERGEGLAAINPSEAGLLKALGGRGEPLMGTQGYGVGGGPIRSYQSAWSNDDDDDSKDTSNQDYETWSDIWGTGDKTVTGPGRTALKATEPEPVTTMDIYGKMNAGTLTESDFNAANEQNIFGKNVVFQNGKILVAQTTPPANANAMAQKVMSGEWTQSQYQQWVTANSKIQYIPWRPPGSQIDSDWKPESAEITSVGDVVSETEGGTPTTGLAGAVSQVTGDQTTSGETVSGAVSGAVTGAVEDLEAGATGLLEEITPEDKIEFADVFNQLNITDAELQQFSGIGTDPNIQVQFGAWLKEKVEEIGKHATWQKIAKYDLGKLWVEIVESGQKPEVQTQEEKDAKKRAQAAAVTASETDTEGTHQGSVDEKVKADTRIETQKKLFNTDVAAGLLSDDDWSTWKKVNKDLLSEKYPDLSEGTLKKLFNDGLMVAMDQGATEAGQYADELLTWLQQTNPEVGEPGHNPNKPVGDYLNLDLPFEAFAASGTFKRLSEGTKRGIWEGMVDKAQRGESFELTSDEVEAYARPAVQIATTPDDADPDKIAPVAPVTDIQIADVGVMATPDNFDEWWSSRGGPEGEFKTAAAAQAAWEADKVTVGPVSDITETTVDLSTINALTFKDIDSIGDLENLSDIFLKRLGFEKQADGSMMEVEPSASPAEKQLAKTTEDFLKSLFAMQAGGQADPAAQRQAKNLYANATQNAIGEGARLRSAETMQTEQNLIETYTAKGTMELQVKLANLETERQVAFKNGDWALTAKIANQEAALTRIITQANIESDAKIKNLETRRILAVEQGENDVATGIANLQKDIAIATINGNLSLQSRALDDAIALAAYRGIQSLEGLDVSVDLAQLEADLTTMGFTLQRDLADMDDKVKRYVANLTDQWNRENAKQVRDDRLITGIIQLISTALTTAAMIDSDIRSKKNISHADAEVEQFLDALNAYQYQYKDPDVPNADPGTFIGIMAQDAEKGGPVGQSFVHDGPGGKKLDMNHGLAAILASQANLNSRLRDLEGK